MSKPFWETKTLFEMSHEEWESVCDGCAKCCLTQLQDEDTEQLVFTDVACDLLDKNTCQCTSYNKRSIKVPTCMTMTKDNVHECAEFAPPTCSYRLLLDGQPLPDWHHLISGDKGAIHKVNQSVRGRVRFMRDVNQQNLEDYVVEWPQTIK